MSALELLIASAPPHLTNICVLWYNSCSDQSPFWDNPRPDYYIAAFTWSRRIPRRVHVSALELLIANARRRSFSVLSTASFISASVEFVGYSANEDFSM